MRRRQARSVTVSRSRAAAARAKAQLIADLSAGGSDQPRGTGHGIAWSVFLALLVLLDAFVLRGRTDPIDEAGRRPHGSRDDEQH